MGKKKNKQIIRPWCWYCEREFEDEKVLMQHQKAKHFKCNLCPRRLNTAGGLAVHIQQVHKLEPENLPRIDNALPGRDGYEVEIFGMEGIPAPDVADYKRRKEIELGLSAGSISQPQAKRPRVENRPLTEEELKAQLEAHKALMGAADTSSSAPVAAAAADTSTGAVYGAPPQAYAPPPAVPSIPTPGMVPGMPPPGQPPFFPPRPFPGQPPFPPFPGGVGLPPGPPPPGFPIPPGFPPPGMMPPGGPPFPPGMQPPFPPPAGALPPFTPIPNTGTPGQAQPPPSSPTPNPVPNSVSLPHHQAPATPPISMAQTPATPATPAPTQPSMPRPDLAQSNPQLKKKTDLKYEDANFLPDEKRAYNPKYYIAKDGPSVSGNDFKSDLPVAAEENRGKKRARAEDFL